MGSMEPERTQVPVELVESSGPVGPIRQETRRARDVSGSPRAFERRWWYGIVAIGVAILGTVLIVRVALSDSTTTLPSLPTSPETSTSDDFGQRTAGLPPAAPGDSVPVVLDPSLRSLGAELVVLVDGGALVRIDPATGQASTVAVVDGNESVERSAGTRLPGSNATPSTVVQATIDLPELVEQAGGQSAPTLWPTAGMWVVVGGGRGTKTVSPTGDVIVLRGADGPVVKWNGQYVDFQVARDGGTEYFKFDVEYEYRAGDSTALGYSRRTRISDPTSLDGSAVIPGDSGRDDTPADLVVMSVMSPGPMSDWVACGTPSGVYQVRRDGAEIIDAHGELLAANGSLIIVSDPRQREMRMYNAQTQDLIATAGADYPGPWPQRGWVARDNGLMAAVTGVGIVVYDLANDGVVDIEPIPVSDPAAVTVNWDETGRFASWLDGNSVVVVDAVERTVSRSAVNDSSARWHLQSVATLVKR